MSSSIFILSILKMLPSLLKVFLTTLLIPSVLGCLPHIKRQASSGYPDLTVGSDGPADAATVDFTIGHLALLDIDLAATRQFMQMSWE
jgi:hypothetical protein